jgi:hypothetical protein
MVLQKLEGFAVAAAASPNTAVKLLGATITRQMKHLTGLGMTLGSPAIAQMLAVVVKAGGLSQDEVDALLSVAEVDDPISEFDVRCAIYAADGSLKI